MTRRYRWLCSLIVAGVLLPLTLMALASPALAQEPTVRWGYRLTPLNIVFIDGGYPEKWGIEAEPILLTTGTESRDALLAGEIDVAELGVTPMLTAAARAQEDLVVIGVSSFGGGKYRVVVPVDSPIQTMDELVGKRIAIRVGSGNYTAFLMWADENGYDVREDFEIANMGDTDAMAALEAGSVDAVIYWEPIPAILVAKGLAREIFNFEGYVYNPVYLTARRGWAKEDPERVAKLLAAWMEAQQFATFQPKEAAAMSAEALQARGVDVSAEAYELALGHEVYETWFYPEVLHETQSTLAFLQEEGAIPESAEIDWATLFDASYQLRAWELITQQTFPAE